MFRFERGHGVRNALAGGLLPRLVNVSKAQMIRSHCQERRTGTGEKEEMYVQDGELGRL